MKTKLICADCGVQFERSNTTSLHCNECSDCKAVEDAIRAVTRIADQKRRGQFVGATDSILTRLAQAAFEAATARRAVRHRRVANGHCSGVIARSVDGIDVYNRNTGVGLFDQDYSLDRQMACD